MIDLGTTYLGLLLKNPLVASASPLCEDVGNVPRMEDAGAAALTWMDAHEYESIRQMQGSMSHRAVAELVALDVFQCPGCSGGRRIVGVHTGGERLRVLRERLGLVSAAPSAAPSGSPPRPGKSPPRPSECLGATARACSRSSVDPRAGMSSTRAPPHNLLS